MVTQLIGKVFTKVFKTSSERYVRQRVNLVSQINALETEFGQLTDGQLREKTADLRARVLTNEERIIGKDLREVLNELMLMPEGCSMMATGSGPTGPMIKTKPNCS